MHSGLKVHAPAGTFVPSPSGGEARAPGTGTTERWPGLTHARRRPACFSRMSGHPPASCVWGVVVARDGRRDAPPFDEQMDETPRQPAARGGDQRTRPAGFEIRSRVVAGKQAGRVAYTTQGPQGAERIERDTPASGARGSPRARQSRPWPSQQAGTMTRPPRGSRRTHRSTQTATGSGLGANA